MFYQTEHSVRINICVSMSESLNGTGLVREELERLMCPGGSWAGNVYMIRQPADAPCGKIINELIVAT